MRWMTVVLVMAGVGAAGAQQAAQSTMALHLHDAQMAVAKAPEAEKGAAWLRLAVRYQDAAQYAEAEHAYKEAVARLKHEQPALLATALDQFGTLYVETGRAAKAEPLERRALALRLEQGDHTAIGVSYTHLAALAFGKGDLAGAEANAEMAVSLLASSDTATPENATPEQQMAALLNLALVRCARAECDKALPVAQRGLALAHASYGDQSVPVGMFDYLLGYAEWKSGNAKQAAEPMQRGIDELGGQLGWGHPTYVAVLGRYQAFLTQTGNAEEAAKVQARLHALRDGSKQTAQQTSLGLGQLP